jgi:hypothetical protein
MAALKILLSPAAGQVKKKITSRIHAQPQNVSCVKVKALIGKE